MTFAEMEWANVGLALLWLGAAIVFARLNRPTEPYQLRRVPRAAAAFVAGHALTVIGLAAVAGRLDFVSFLILLPGILILGMVAFLWVLIIDIVAVLLRVTRTPIGLAGGIVMNIFFAYGWIFLIGEALIGAGATPQSPVFFTPGLLAAATGLVWWSELPRPDSDEESAVFD